MLAGSQGPSEQEILAVYKSNSEAVFHEGAFNYAKALCCLRWISVIEVQCIHIHARICIDLVHLYLIRCYNANTEWWHGRTLQFTVVDAIHCMAVCTPVCTAALSHTGCMEGQLPRPWVRWVQIYHCQTSAGHRLPHSGRRAVLRQVAQIQAITLT